MKLKNTFILTASSLSKFFAAGACALILALPHAAPLRAGEVVLQDARMLAAFDDATGALTRMENLETGWTMQRRPEFGMSFRMHAPLPDRRDNFIFGQKQRLAGGIEKISGTRLRMTWKNPVSEHGGAVALTFTATVTLKDGELIFDASLDNQSKLVIESVEYPYWGDFAPPDENSTLKVRTMWYGDLKEDEVYPRFENRKGYWGVMSPMKTFDSNQSQICLLQSRREGLYVCMDDPALRYFLQFTFEQLPGVADSITNLVPKNGGAGTGGVEPRLEFRATHFIFAQPGSRFDFAPVRVAGYRGDWHAGIDLYKKWRATWFKPARTPQWLNDVHSWQQLRINSPEDDLRVQYQDLVKYGEECARNHVGAIQLVGWNYLGQDGNDPMQDHDPRLGTREDLKDAIAKIQAMGVKMVLFGKLNWADLTTRQYPGAWRKYASLDPYGIPYQQGGYNYVTPTQLAGINTHRRAVLDFSSPPCRDMLTKEFEKLLYYGASGWLFDENCHHSPVKYCFSTDHDHDHPGRPGYIFSGDMPLAAQMRAAADKVNPDFVFAGEGQMDWLMQSYPCSYFRIDSRSTPVDRYIDSQAPLMVAVTGFDDREMLNLIFLWRYIISYEPYNFKGHIEDFPLTLAYGKKIDDLRRKYKARLWDAEFRDTLGATVTSDGPHRHAVYVTPEGKRAVIVINQSRDKPLTAQVTLPNAGKLSTVTPEAPDAKPCDGTLQIPARSAAVILENL